MRGTQDLARYRAQKRLRKAANAFVEAGQEHRATEAKNGRATGDAKASSASTLGSDAEAGVQLHKGVAASAGVGESTNLTA